MNKVLICILFITLLGLSACRTLMNSPKYQFSDGYYTAKTSGKPANKVYVDTEESFIKVYPANRKDNQVKLDTSRYNLLSLEGLQTTGPQKTLFFRQTSFDIDFLTMPIKYMCLMFKRTLCLD